LPEFLVALQDRDAKTIRDLLTDALKGSVAVIVMKILLNDTI